MGIRCVGVHGWSGWEVRVTRMSGRGLEIGVGWSRNGRALIRGGSHG